jgi:bifunctional enzyme CysN/CysC
VQAAAFRPRVLWFTGLSGAGKSTLAEALKQHLQALGVNTFILDGDVVRQGLNQDLGFSAADRAESVRRVAAVAQLMRQAGVMVLVAMISPSQRERDKAMALIGSAHFLQVYVNTPLSVCEARDPKGLYRKARSGQLPNMTGIDSPYEAPEQAQCVMDTSTTSVPEAVQQLMHLLKT